jgi:hypothetical protein
MGDRILCLVTFVALFPVAIVAQKMKNRTVAKGVMVVAFLAAITISAPAAWRFHYCHPEAYETPWGAAVVGTAGHVFMLALVCCLGFMDARANQHRGARRPTPRQDSE